jgi:hypothetical protein
MTYTKKIKNNYRLHKKSNILKSLSKKMISSNLTKTKKDENGNNTK